MDDRPVARRTDPATSWAAADSVINLTETRLAILRVLMNNGPMTDEQIANAVGLHYTSPSGLRTRRKELVAAGKIRDSGRRETMESGRKAIVWELDRPRDTLFDL